MGNRGVGAVALGLAAGVLALALTGAGRATARAGPSSGLYYETHAGTALSIDRLSLIGPRRITPIVTLPDVGVFGIAVAGGNVYWVTETAPADRGSVMGASVGGGHVRSLVSGLPAPNSIVAAGGFLYWSDQKEIGRVALDGSRVRRRFIVLPQEPGGGVADGLAAAGTHLYFSRCTDDAIGRVGLARGPITRRFIATGPRTCPQGLAVAGSHLYWTQLGSGTIGRASLDGRGADGRWLNIHTAQGPFQLAADRSHIYWTWGGVDGSPAYAGRANADGSHLERRFLADSIYPLALTGGG